MPVLPAFPRPQRSDDDAPPRARPLLRLAAGSGWFIATCFACLATLTLISLPVPAQTVPQAAPAAAAPARTERALEAERDACLSGRSGQPREVCLREFHAAREEMRRGRLDSSSPEALRANALARCEPLPAADREACRRMAIGEGGRDGTVAGGGQLRWLKETVPGTPAPTASAPAPASAATR